MSEQTDKSTKEGEVFKDSLGQENPAEDLQRKTIKEKEELDKKAAADAEKRSESQED